MTITLQLSTEQERRLEEGTKRRDEALVRQVLLQAVDAAIAGLLARPEAQVSPQDFRDHLRQLAEEFADAPTLSDEAVSRAGIYGDHP
jgi:hypothetical protein